MTQQPYHYTPSVAPGEDPYASTGGNDSLAFDGVPVGTSYTGTVLSVPKVRQQTDLRTKEPKFWPNGNPQETTVFDFDVDGLGARAVWAKIPSNLFANIQAASQRAGRRVEPGVRLRITWVGEEPTGPGLNPKKLYAVEFLPSLPGGPGDAFAPAPAYAPAPTPSYGQPAQQAYAPAAQQAYAPPAQAEAYPWNDRYAAFGQTPATWAALPDTARASIAGIPAAPAASDPAPF